MVGIFWTSYAVAAGIALGFIGVAAGLLISQGRPSARKPTHQSPLLPQIPPLNRR